MDKNIIYITDSSMLYKLQESAIYSIISLSGSIETLEQIANRSCEMFEGTILSEESFYEWYQLNENKNRLFNFLANLYNERAECLFTSYLSDHDYSRFVLYMQTLFSIDENTPKEVLKNIDVLYQNFDKGLLQSFNDSIDKDKLVEFNTRFLMSIKSILPKESFENIKSAAVSLEKQMEFILQANKISDLSIVDYSRYSASLIKLVNEYAISTIWASEHSAMIANMCITAQHHMTTDAEDIRCNYQIITNFDESPVLVLLKNLSIICDFVWNQLHRSDSIDTLSSQDKLITIYLWLLFQSKYSSWMISSADFVKIKLILEDIKEQND